MAKPDRPRPVADPLTQPFWENAHRGVLSVQRCGECGSFQHPPHVQCQHCASASSLTFERVSGTARLVTWTKVIHPIAGGFEAAVPYLCLVVELVEQKGLYMVSDYPGDGAELAGSLRVDAAMRVEFEEAEPGLVLPQFRPA